MVPLSHETFGRLGAPAYSFLVELAAHAAAHGSVSKQEFIRNSLRDLSVTLCRGVTKQVRASAPLRLRVAGRALMQGMTVPSADLTADLRMG